MVGLFWVVMGGGMVYNNPIGTNKIEKNKVKKKKRQIQKLKPGKCSPCLTNLSHSAARKYEKQLFLRVNKPKKFMILQNVNYASSSIIYLMKHILRHKQHVGKKERTFIGNVQVLFSCNPHKSGALRVCITFPQITYKN